MVNPFIQAGIVEPLVAELLTVNGRIDGAAGKNQTEGWLEIAQDLGFPPYARTPANEAYLDGWYVGAMIYRSKKDKSK